MGGLSDNFCFFSLQLGLPVCRHFASLCEGGGPGDVWAATLLSWSGAPPPFCFNWPSYLTTACVLTFVENDWRNDRIYMYMWCICVHVNVYSCVCDGGEGGAFLNVVNDNRYSCVKSIFDLTRCVYIHVYVYIYIYVLHVHKKK